VGGTALMLDVVGAEANSIKKIVVASSRAVTGEGKYRDASGAVVYPMSRAESDLAAGRFELYDRAGGDPLEPLGTDEQTPFSPVSVYGITKQAQEQLVAAGCTALGLPYVALRYQNVFGPGQSLSNPYTGILSIFSTRMLAGRDIEIFEDGYESRDFVFIDDVVSATVAALTRPSADNHVLSIGSGVRTSVLDAARTLQAALGTDVALRVSGRYRVGDIRHSFADISRAKRAIGFQPTVSFADGVGRFVEWVRATPNRADAYERSLSELAERGLLRGLREGWAQPMPAPAGAAADVSRR
jgi:dTDP-L-rhamnose 4-epimerase